MQDTQYFYFDGLEHPVQLVDCAHLSHDFSLLFPDRDYLAGKEDCKPVIRIEFDGESYHLATSWMKEPNSYRDKVDVLCDLVAQLGLARSYYDLEALYLHAAGVEINGRLVVFPSVFRAGKSFLTACLIAAGYRYLGDDIVPLEIDSCKARTPGFAPRLRIPLPETTDKKSKQFIDSHMKLAGNRYAYLDIETRLRISKNELSEIGAFVLLEREEGCLARLEKLPVATVFQQLIKQNFAREVDAARILATLTEVVSNAQCYRLRYDRADEAVSLLTNQFSSWPQQDTHLAFEQTKAGISSNSSNNRPTDGFIQNNRAQKIRIEEENFLTSPDGTAIYHLNPIASGIWELLAEAISREEIIDILASAFPGVERTVIENDVTKILRRFESKNLITQ